MSTACAATQPRAKPSKQARQNPLEPHGIPTVSQVHAARAGLVVLWALGLAGRTRWIAATLSIAALAGVLSATGQNLINLAPAPGVVAATERWQPWEPGRVEQTLATGQPVMVDFTAAWCVTCQYNKKTTLSHPAVLADLEAKNVQLLRASGAVRGVGRD